MESALLTCGLGRVGPLWGSRIEVVGRLNPRDGKGRLASTSASPGPLDFLYLFASHKPYASHAETHRPGITVQQNRSGHHGSGGLELDAPCVVRVFRRTGGGPVTHAGR